ncbi:prepilin-type N-terminal cleavage/methylation domain-containing protein [Bacillus sp. ISL-55]|uniref:prepilin-type N-terminal cleavage/methylation domain-containing protein n=1 Tax=Bacillus sp. ISL-55 TaxID=2819134 RepID=UPI001BE6D36D|nr:prepilin-type N-terminal cleavage/methylation domain-containing protein [Bacillus sp. ISL-55]MBT2693055.1 prepilin-type N-terminal cleavage/methylation domain-containing protein [Bacillus sp. ISL-55]
MLKNMKKKLKSQRGFTLVELLAVIVIIGIIAAIAVPSIGNVIQKSKDNAKVVEALSIINAAKLAHAEDDSFNQWKHDAEEGAEGAAGYAGLGKYVSKVKDDDYTVTFNPVTNVYSISNHDASEVLPNTSANASVTEDQLAEFTE